jgi:signal transduction histidine kinase
MATLMRATDWSKTKLGPVDGWPQSLRTVVGVLLGSRFPMMIWWGPNLLNLYNDAYRPILRDKHPSLGVPAAELWAEVWDFAGPLARGILDGGSSTWMEDVQLFIKSGAIAEETYFTFSYSPIPEDDGHVGGLLNTVQETTLKVRSERQIRMLHELAARAADAESEREAARIAIDVLSSNELDLPFVLLYSLGQEANEAHLVGATGLKDYEGPAKFVTASLDAQTGGWPLGDVVRSHRHVIVDDLAARFGQLPLGTWNARPERAIVLPLSRAGQRPYALLVAGLSPHRAYDERYERFFEATADQVANAISTAQAYESEKKRAESLAEIDRAKTAFFSNVSHEFRTPLTLILSPIEDALAQPEKSLQGESLAAVHRSALRLLRLVNSLLDFARIEAGRLQLSFVRTDLATLTTDLASSFRSLVERAKLKFLIDCPPMSEPVYVDPAQWEKIVLNLLSNAFKFTLRGEIAISVTSSDDWVCLTVRDTGSGIPASELPHVFERFHRVQGTKGRSFEGTGIGLSLVQELVKLHGGSVHVSSIEGEGTTFEVRLRTGGKHLPPERIVEAQWSQESTMVAPYLLEASQWIAGGSDAQDVLVEPIQEAAVPANVQAGSDKERASVLVADDNADMRDYLARLLAVRWNVQVATDGREALGKARDQPPDLVLSDVMMPVLDGVGLLKALRDHPRTSHIPVVLLSARAGEEAVLEGLQTGADDYLVKPFSARELVARVQTHLDLARLRREWAGELERANKELESFSYSVSHDLRAPLRAIDGFSKLLASEYGSELKGEAKEYLDRIRTATARMSSLIDDLLHLSRITRAHLECIPVNLAELARGVAGTLRAHEPSRAVDVSIAEPLEAQADPHLMKVLFENLLGNAWKFTSKRPDARIWVGKEQGPEQAFFVRDNGAGFDMKYADKLFAPFQRLHKASEFEGTGIGLATVHRVVTRHGGRIWATSAPGQGATFFFTLGGSRRDGPVRAIELGG